MFQSMRNTDHDQQWVFHSMLKPRISQILISAAHTLHRNYQSLFTLLKGLLNSMLAKFSRGLKSLLTKCDLFSISQFVKYKGEGQYSTATGGFFSVAILTIFAVLFTSMAIKTVDRQIINWSSETTNEMEPSPTTISVSSPNAAPFLFTAGILYLNLNDPNVRYFDFELIQTVWSNYREVSRRNVSLVACTEQHFNITDTLRNSFYKISGNTWLCPPIGETFTLAGKFTSAQVNAVQLKVLKCNPSADPSRPCANETVMKQMEAQMGQFLMTQFFINPLLNPGSQHFLDYYLEDRNYIAFTSEMGGYSNVHVQDYTVITDESILPFAAPKEESGVIVPQLFQNINFEVTTNVYAHLVLYKSSTSVTYYRSFYKIDAFFSYVGGLVGVIMGGMMLLSAYNQDSFELNLANDLLRREDGNALERYNIFYYILNFFQSLIKKVFKKCQLQSLRQFEEVRQEMSRQLDISVILARLLFLERSFQMILDQGQFQAMHLREKPSMQALKRLRSYHHMREALISAQNKQESPPDVSRLDLMESNFKENAFTPHRISEPNEKEDESGGAVDQQGKKAFKQSLELFQDSLHSGNKTSLKINDKIRWKFQSIPTRNQESRHSQKKQSQISQGQSQRPDPKTQLLRIAAKSQTNIHEIGNSFEMLNFANDFS